MDFKNI